MKAYLDPSIFQRTKFEPPFLSSSEPGPSRILELGSGTGIVAAQLSRQLKSRHDLLIVTDLPEVCPLLEKNLQTDASREDSYPTVLVKALSWGNYVHATSIYEEIHRMHDVTSHSALTHIICSDLVSTLKFI